MLIIVSNLVMIEALFTCQMFVDYKLYILSSLFIIFIYGNKYRDACMIWEVYVLNYMKYFIIIIESSSGRFGFITEIENSLEYDLSIFDIIIESS